MATPWIGTKKILVIPTIVTGSNAYFPPPDNWVDEINRRIYYDPHPTLGLDRSLRRYIHTISYGKAQLVADISEPISVPVASDGGCRTSAAIQAHPYSHLYEFVFVIFTDGPHPCGGQAAWGGLFEFSPPRQGNILHGRSRVKMGESLGTWAMELLHMTTGFGDLYNTDPHPGRFDEMACNCGTHPSAYTKMNMGWISSGNIPFVGNGQNQDYLLHAISLLQPPPPGSVSAIRIATGIAGKYYIIEARLRSDQFDKQTAGSSSGIPSEGVVIYEVDPNWPLQLRTPQALSVGQEFNFPNLGVSINVKEAINGGFRINVQFPVNVVCDSMRNKINAIEDVIASLQEQLQTASPNQKPGIINMIRSKQAEITDLKIKMVELGCSTV